MCRSKEARLCHPLGDERVIYRHAHCWPFNAAVDSVVACRRRRPFLVDPPTSIACTQTHGSFPSFVISSSVRLSSRCSCCRTYPAVRATVTASWRAHNPS